MENPSILKRRRIICSKLEKERFSNHHRLPKNFEAFLFRLLLIWHRVKRYRNLITSREIFFFSPSLFFRRLPSVAFFGSMHIFHNVHDVRNASKAFIHFVLPCAKCIFLTGDGDLPRAHGHMGHKCGESATE